MGTTLSKRFCGREESSQSLIRIEYLSASELSDNVTSSNPKQCSLDIDAETVAIEGRSEQSPNRPILPLAAAISVNNNPSMAEGSLNIDAQTSVTDQRSDQLTNKQIVCSAATIFANNMAAIAEGYLDIDDATIKNKKYENKDDAEGFNREIIKTWLYKNPDNQVKVNLKMQQGFATSNQVSDELVGWKLLVWPPIMTRISSTCRDFFF